MIYLYSNIKMSCSHLINDNLAVSLQGKLIYKDECTKCFASCVFYK